MSRRLKLVLAIIVLGPIVVYLLNSNDNLFSARVLSVDEFMVRVAEGKVTENQIVLRGKVEGKSIRYDQMKYELRFDLRSHITSNRVHVLLKGKNNLNLKNSETIKVEGTYMVEKLFIAHKVIKE